MITTASPATEAPVADEPKTTKDWEPYCGTYVRHTTPAGSARAVKLLEVKSDAAHIGLGKHIKPRWVPLAELSPGIKSKRKRVEGEQRNMPVPYVICDTQHHKWLVTGRGTDTHWVEDVSLATEYPNINGAWSARQYHKKKRPQLFGAHVDVVPLGEAKAWMAKWGKASAAHAPAAELAQRIIGRELKDPQPERTPAPAASPVDADLFARWAAKRSELADAEAMLAAIRQELVPLEAQLDIEIRRRQAN